VQGLARAGEVLGGGHGETVYVDTARVTFIKDEGP
jgi:hypothetical protein